MKKVKTGLPILDNILKNGIPKEKVAIFTGQSLDTYNCIRCGKIVINGYCTKCGAIYENLDNACNAIIDVEIIKALRGEQNDLL